MKGSWRCHGTSTLSHSCPAHQRQALRAAVLCYPGHCARGVGEPAQGLSAADPGSLSANRRQTQGWEEDQSKVRLATTLWVYTAPLSSIKYFGDTTWPGSSGSLFKHFPSKSQTSRAPKKAMSTLKDYEGPTHPYQFTGGESAEHQDSKHPCSLLSWPGTQVASQKGFWDFRENWVSHRSQNRHLEWQRTESQSCLTHSTNQEPKGPWIISKTNQRRNTGEGETEGKGKEEKSSCIVLRSQQISWDPFLSQERAPGASTSLSTASQPEQ